MTGPSQRQLVAPQTAVMQSHSRRRDGNHELPMTRTACDCDSVNERDSESREPHCGARTHTQLHPHNRVILRARCASYYDHVCGDNSGGPNERENAAGTKADLVAGRCRMVVWRFRATRWDTTK